MGSIVGAWQRALHRCAVAGIIVLVAPMGRRLPSRLLSRDGVTVLVLNARHPLSERVREVDRQLFAQRLYHALGEPV